VRKVRKIVKINVERKRERERLKKGWVDRMDNDMNNANVSKVEVRRRCPMKDKDIRSHDTIIIYRLAA